MISKIRRARWINWFRNFKRATIAFFLSYEKKRHHPFRNLGSRFNNLVAGILLNKSGDLYLSSFKVISRFLIDEVTRYDGPYPYVDGLILRASSNYTSQPLLHDPADKSERLYAAQAFEPVAQYVHQLLGPSPAHRLPGRLCIRHCSDW